MRFEASIHIDASPERAWDWLRAWERSSQWMIGTTVEVLSKSGEGIGARVRAVTSLVGLKLVDVMTVTRWEPLSRIEVRHERWPLQGIAWFGVRPEGSGARVEWVEDITVPFGLLGRIVASVLRAPVQWGLGLSLKKLKRRVEASS
jgi:hypothetical protein